MKCPFCGKEGNPVESISGDRIECRCPHCRSLLAVYLRDMSPRLRDLISLGRFKGGQNDKG